MDIRTLPRLAVMAATLSISACACGPPIGDSAAQVVERCGQPAEIFSAPASALDQQEWRYGDTYVGLMAGSVAYVLK